MGQHGVGALQFVVAAFGVVNNVVVEQCQSDFGRDLHLLLATLPPLQTLLQVLDGVVVALWLGIGI